ncbi:hypothetical protein FNF31_03369 [Cafeteria roenbergensis]|uniref:Uncharacterized protein n=1 Tax=Cafeteria roenbergensis TaxID=33653 RepID=A0A5A8DC06_CAFRO|nr:hypothetical protein FNF31_03369 [Cafeteria roenbergensis]
MGESSGLQALVFAICACSRLGAAAAYSRRGRRGDYLSPLSEATQAAVLSWLAIAAISLGVIITMAMVFRMEWQQYLLRMLTGKHIHLAAALRHWVLLRVDKQVLAAISVMAMAMVVDTVLGAPVDSNHDVSAASLQAIPTSLFVLPVAGQLSKLYEQGSPWFYGAAFFAALYVAHPLMVIPDAGSAGAAPSASQAPPSPSAASHVAAAAARLHGTLLQRMFRSPRSASGMFRVYPLLQTFGMRYFDAVLASLWYFPALVALGQLPVAASQTIRRLVDKRFEGRPNLPVQSAMLVFCEVMVCLLCISGGEAVASSILLGSNGVNLRFDEQTQAALPILPLGASFMFLVFVVGMLALLCMLYVKLVGGVYTALDLRDAETAGKPTVLQVSPIFIVDVDHQGNRTFVVGTKKPAEHAGDLAAPWLPKLKAAMSTPARGVVLRVATLPSTAVQASLERFRALRPATLWYRARLGRTFAADLQGGGGGRLRIRHLCTSAEDGNDEAGFVTLNVKCGLRVELSMRGVNSVARRNSI